MTREFIYLPPFEKNWSKLGLTDKDLQHLENLLINDPQLGDVIEGTGGLRKMRFALPNRGKSASTRVLYVDFAYFEKLFVVNVYSKNKQESLSNTEKAMLKHAVKALEESLKGADDIG